MHLRRLRVLGRSIVLFGAIACAPASALGMDGPGVLSSKAAVGTFGGRRVAYAASAEAFDIAGPDGRPGARLLTFDYLAAPAPGGAARPVVFVFNGGPGSSSAWLHMAGFGPRVVTLPQPGDASGGPFPVADNPDAVLDVADLVFVDPAGTGYSRLLPGAKPKDFYGVDEDARATADLIRQWLTRHDRWSSPRYLVGESYGTIRVAATLKLLMGGTAVGRFQAIDVAGALLLGSVLDDAAARTAPDADQGWAMLLPSFAATAWRWRKAGAGLALAAHVERARRFAREQYLPALYLGDALSAERRRGLAQALSALIGLPVGEIEQADLRVDPKTFASELLADRGLRLSLYDARFSWPRVVETGEDPVGEDPSMTRLGPPVMAALMGQLRDGFGLVREAPYEMISWVPNHQWSSPPERDYAADIGRAMRQNPAMRVVAAMGDYDLATPMGATEYALSHSGVPRARLSEIYFPAGHMTYADPVTRVGLNRALRALLTGSGVQ